MVNTWGYFTLIETQFISTFAVLLNKICLVLPKAGNSLYFLPSQVFCLSEGQFSQAVLEVRQSNVWIFFQYSDFIHFASDGEFLFREESFSLSAADKWPFWPMTLVTDHLLEGTEKGGHLRVGEGPYSDEEFVNSKASVTCKTLSQFGWFLKIDHIIMTHGCFIVPFF